MLNHNSPVPLYRQLANIILDRIQKNEYSTGEKIPSEPELAKKFGVGRPTVRQATDILVRKRILKRIKGSGTFVAEPTEDVDLFSLAGTSSAFQKKGITITKKIVQKPKLIIPKDNKYNPMANKNTYYFRRLNMVNEEPILLEDFYLNAELFINFDRINLEERSLSRVVEDEYFLTPSGGKQYFKIGYLKDTKQDLLKILPTKPVLIVHRHLDFNTIKSGIYSVIYCQTDRFDFSQTINISK